jgi:hypothetical protein
MEEREHKSRGAGCTIVGVALILLLVLYVLGIGPAAWLCHEYPATEDFLSWVYYPLGKLCFYCDSVDRAINFYMGLWHEPRQPPNFN